MTDLGLLYFGIANPYSILRQITNLPQLKHPSRRELWRTLDLHNLGLQSILDYISLSFLYPS